MIRLRCKDCNSYFELSRTYPVYKEARSMFCVFCGSSNIEHIYLNMEETYWLVLSQELNTIPEIAKSMYDLWHNAHTDARFLVWAKERMALEDAFRTIKSMISNE